MDKRHAFRDFPPNVILIPSPTKGVNLSPPTKNAARMTVKGTCLDYLTLDVGEGFLRLNWNKRHEFHNGLKVLRRQGLDTETRAIIQRGAFQSKKPAELMSEIMSVKTDRFDPVGRPSINHVRIIYLIYYQWY